MMFNMAPLLTTLLSYPFLGERVTNLDIVGLLVAFTGIAMMILCGEKRETRAQYTPTPILYFVLIMLPICASLGNIAQRKVKKLNFNVITIYMNVSLLVIFLPACLLMGDNLNIITQFSFTDWFFMLMVCIGTIVSHSLRFMAIQRHTVSGLQPYTFLQPLQQFVTDVVLFERTFTVYQIMGMILLISIYLVQLFFLLLAKKKS